MLKLLAGGMYTAGDSGTDARAQIGTATEALSISMALREPAGVAFALHNLAHVHSQMRDLARCLKCAELAWEIVRVRQLRHCFIVLGTFAAGFSALHHPTHTLHLATMLVGR